MSWERGWRRKELADKFSFAFDVLSKRLESIVDLRQIHERNGVDLDLMEIPLD